MNVEQDIRKVLGTERNHWPEYLMEAAGLGSFMFSACVFGVLLQHPASPVVSAIPGGFERRALFGMAMGLTSIAIVYSPWGKQSGAHLNPSLTLAFFRLGKIAPRDVAFYVAAQFAGGIVGVALARALLGPLVAHSSVGFVATVPGRFGVAPAFVAEAAISCGMMLLVLTVSNTPRLSRLTGLLAGSLAATYIAFEAPVSGMSMNPARTLASAVHAMNWTSLWLYFIAPPLGMLLGAQIYVAVAGSKKVFCAKLHHDNDRRCIFCESREARSSNLAHLLMEPERRTQNECLP